MFFFHLKKVRKIFYSLLKKKYINFKEYYK